MTRPVRFRACASGVCVVVASLGFQAGPAGEALRSHAILIGATVQDVALSEARKALAHPDAKIRLAAVRMMRDSRSPDASAALVPLITDPVGDVQLAAIDAILSLHLAEPINVRTRVALVVEVRGGSRAQGAFEAGPLAVAPVAVPPDLAPRLVEALADEEPRVRTDAAYLLGTLTAPPLDAAGVQALLDALVHREAGVRVASARVLGRLQVKSAGEPLIYAMNDPFESVRFAAMRALGDLREASAISALEDQIDFYRGGSNAEAALDGLARIAHPTSLARFNVHARDGSAGMRRAALEGLARTSSPTFAGDIEALNPGQDRSVRLARAFALQKLGRAYLGSIVEGLAVRSTVVQARGYLLEIGPAGVPGLLPFLHDAQPTIRAEVAGVLGLIGNETIVAQIDPLRADPDADVAAAAERAIARLKLRR
jgi:HEAT repeat protein